MKQTIRLVSVKTDPEFNTKTIQDIVEFDADFERNQKLICRWISQLLLIDPANNEVRISVLKTQ